MYAYAGIDETYYEIKVLDPYADLCDNWGKCGFQNFVDLKKKNPDLKTLLAIGGYNEGSVKYSQMASTSSRRQAFITSTINLLNKFGFDGIQFDWQYPTQAGGSPNDKENYITLLKEIKEEFTSEGLILGVGMASSKFIYETAYDIPAVASEVDYMGVFTYDFHGTWETHTNHHCMLDVYPNATVLDDRFLNIKFVINDYLDLGAPPEKLVMGIGLVSPCWYLSDHDDAGMYAPSLASSFPSPLEYYKLCYKHATESWVIVNEEVMNEPYSYAPSSSYTWCPYNDPSSATVKAVFAKDKGLFGASVWSIDSDDYPARCDTRPYNLILSMKEAFEG